jgi:hypothetical protein
MNLARVIAISAALAVAITARSPAQAADAAAEPGDLGVAADIDAVRFDIALQEIAAARCPNSDQHILYYVDGSRPELLKVRTRSDLGAILDTRLHHLQLGDWPRSYAGAAIGPVARSPEVARSIAKLGASLSPPIDAPAVVGAPVPPRHISADRMRLPREIDGVTVEEALDQTARAFGGIVTVAYCDQPRLLEFEITDAPLSPRGSAHSPPRAGVDDLGIASQVLSGATDKAVDWLGDDCKSAHILYYADTSEPGLVEVRTRSDLAEVLDIPVHHLHLASAEQRNVMKAVYAVEFSPDVRRAAGVLHAELTGPLPYGAYARLPDGTVWIVSDLVAGGPPKLPSELDNISVERVLDQLAVSFREFGDVVVVGACTNPRRIDIVFWEQGLHD